MRLAAEGLGDAEEIVAVLPRVEGRAVHPPAPVHLRGEKLVNGDIFFTWVRRSRSGWNWLSGSDTPLAEEKEAYRLELGGSNFQRTIETIEPAYLYSVAQQEQDGGLKPITIGVAQIGTFGMSRTARLTLSL